MSNSGVLGGQRMSRSPHLAPPNYILTLLYAEGIAKGNECLQRSFVYRDLNYDQGPVTPWIRVMGKFSLRTQVTFQLWSVVKKLRDTLSVSRQSRESRQSRKSRESRKSRQSGEWVSFHMELFLPSVQSTLMYLNQIFLPAQIKSGNTS